MNDVFEFSPEYYVEYNREETNKICHYFLGTKNEVVTSDKSIYIFPPEATSERKLKFTNEFEKDKSEAMFSWFTPIAHSFIQHHRNYSRMLCFSESCNVELMWAHYANSHKGVCVKFNIKSLPVNQISFFHKVRYSDEPLKINLFEMATNQPNFIKSLIDSHITKSSKWEYEKEWRLRLSANTDYYKEIRFLHFSHNIKFIDSIIFGLRTPQAEKIEILDLIKSTNIKAYTCTQEKVNSRNIIFKKIETDDLKKFGQTSNTALKEI